MALSNDELTKLRSRLYRGYRAPQAVTQFFGQEQIVSADVDPVTGNINQMVQRVTFDDGTTATKTTVFTYDGNNKLSSNTVTYDYDDITP